MTTDALPSRTSSPPANDAAQYTSPAAPVGAHAGGLGVDDRVDRKYVLRREIARGGMGVVFEALHEFTGRVVAIKLVVSPPGAADPALASECRERLLREARALTVVRHPNVVEVLDAGVCAESDAPYVVLEMLEGRTLDGILAARRQLSERDTAHLGRQLCEALAFAHAQGVVHRDIKPSNVFVARNELGHETVKLFDFGVAVVPAADPATQRKLTRAGELLGTPEYMAPEQLLAKEQVDYRCDVYAAGVTLFECLTGDVPYAGTYPEILMQVMNATEAPRVRARRPDVTSALAHAIERALAREPDARYVDALAFADALVCATGLERGSSMLLGAFHARPGVRLEASGARASAPRMTVPPAETIASVQSIVPEDWSPATPEARAAIAPLVESGAQRRRHARAPYVTAARVTRADGSVVLNARIENVSEGGLLLITEKPLDEHERVEVRFALPTTGKLAATVATARWTRRARRDRHATGLVFEEVGSEARGAIARGVEQMRPSME